MHQSVTRNGGAVTTLQGGDVFGAELYFDLLEFIRFDAVLTHGINDGVIGIQRLVGAVLRFVEPARNQERRPVVIE